MSGMPLDLTCDLSGLLCREIVYGVVRWRDTLDWLAKQKQKSSKK